MRDRGRPTTAPGLKECPAALLARIRGLLEAEAMAVMAAVGAPSHAHHLLPGKLLRSRFGARIADVTGADPEVVAQACAAIEMTHTASLCHDDVIDNALVRRYLPTLWREATPSAAVLVGDVLLCQATMLIATCAGGRYLLDFLRNVAEVCATEARQEMVLRGRPVGPEACLEVARGKTGPLFAFLGRVAAGNQADLAKALEEAGYGIGTAYQLADDLVDVAGDPAAAGKTLGTDRSRGKFTLPQSASEGLEVTGECVRGLLRQAAEVVSPWPGVREAVQAYIAGDLVPAMGLQRGLAELGREATAN